MSTGLGGAGDEPGGHDLTPPGPPVEPAGAEVDGQPVHPAPNPYAAQPAPNPYAAQPAPNPYGPNPYTQSPAPSTDKALGWTGVGLTAAICVPLAPLAGVVLAIIALARRRFRPRWVLVLCLVAGLGLTALQASVVPAFLDGVQDGMNEALDDEADRARDSGERATIAPTSLEQGDCFDDPHFASAGPEEAVVAALSLVPCDRPHDAEVFATITVPGDRFPGPAAIDRRSLGCVEQFADFTGVSYTTSSYDMVTYYPTSTSWNTLDDRAIHCVIGDSDEQVTGSLKGAGRGEAPPLGKRVANYRLIVGDCYDQPDENSGMVVRRSCDGPHQAEVFAVVAFKPGKFPGDAEIDRRTDARCNALFRKFVGIPYADSTYVYNYWKPDEQTWDLHDRVFHCALLSEGNATLTGSARGSRR